MLGVAITLLGFVEIEMEEKINSYPIAKTYSPDTQFGTLPINC